MQNLKETIERSKSRFEKNESKDNILQLSKFLKDSTKAPVVAIPVESGLEFVEIDSIIKLNASDGYTTIFLQDESKIVSSKPLMYYLSLLDPNHFFQVHRAFIINLNYIKKYHKVGFVQLSDGSEIPVAKTKKAEFLNLFRK